MMSEVIVKRVSEAGRTSVTRKQVENHADFPSQRKKTTEKSWLI